MGYIAMSSDGSMSKLRSRGQRWAASQVSTKNTEATEAQATKARGPSVDHLTVRGHLDLCSSQCMNQGRGEVRHLWTVFTEPDNRTARRSYNHLDTCTTVVDQSITALQVQNRLLICSELTGLLRAVKAIPLARTNHISAQTQQSRAGSVFLLQCICWNPIVMSDFTRRFPLERS